MGTLAGDEIESGGLTGALSTLLVPLAESGVQVSISVGELDCEGRVRSLIHRVAQELVRNVAKHAGAHQVELTLTQERGEIRLLPDGRRAGVRHRRRPANASTAVTWGCCSSSSGSRTPAGCSRSAPPPGAAPGW